ncbi:hypothetical protein FC093_01385 [Ilyomonas limi]|uniref:Uncharacterized protein n=1 Tax=Ilyomonas limi TaxID=2575867 RepID=A0A4U3L9E6_9BACT|nr:hypothetical protein [Ilyomonas limi]TKK71702.1 hypothetical protein FC093_01385 [Ilyomonas limi]
MEKCQTKRPLLAFILLCTGLSTKAQLLLNINTLNGDTIVGTSYQMLRTDTLVGATNEQPGTHSSNKVCNIKREKHLMVFLHA